MFWQKSFGLQFERFNVKKKSTHYKGVGDPDTSVSYPNPVGL